MIKGCAMKDHGFVLSGASLDYIRGKSEYRNPKTMNPKPATESSGPL